MDTPPLAPDSWITWTVVAAVAVAALVVFIVLRKSRLRPGEHVFRASRLSRGNRLFPAQVLITRDSVTCLRPQWLGKLEESIHIAHISSIKIDTDLVFSDVLIETTGGHNPVVCHGHFKGDAVKMKRIIEQFQTEYYGKRS